MENSDYVYLYKMHHKQHLSKCAKIILEDVSADELMDIIEQVKKISNVT